jgi:hypothetical protein
MSDITSRISQIINGVETIVHGRWAAPSEESPERISHRREVLGKQREVDVLDRHQRGGGGGAGVVVIVVGGVRVRAIFPPDLIPALPFLRGRDGLGDAIPSPVERRQRRLRLHARSE